MKNWFWNDYYEILILSNNLNFIYVNAKERRFGLVFDMTFVYDNPITPDRRTLWPKLLSLKPLHNGPWCCIGDFNEMVHSMEKDGLRLVEQGRLDRFRDFFNDSELMDLELQGCNYTWVSNPRNGFVTREKIDRVLANWSWRQMFPHALAIALHI